MFDIWDVLSCPYFVVNWICGWKFSFCLLFIGGMVVINMGVDKINLSYCVFRITFVSMKEEKRFPRSYKATDADYKSAMKRAKKEGVKLSQMVEEVIGAYGDGAFSVHFIKPNSSNKKQ